MFKMKKLFILLISLCFTSQTIGLRLENLGQNITSTINNDEIISEVGKDSSLEISQSAEENDVNEIEKLRENWDCSNDDAINKRELLEINNMIKSGEEIIKKQKNVANETILVLGNAGAGKTTFVQFMAGDNSKLMSIETNPDSGQYLIEDGIKIGNSMAESFTLYPEQFSNGSNISFTDTPGFSDTRSEKHEIIASYIMKKYLEQIKKVKIVLLVTHSSLQMGMYKNDFIDLLNNVNSFIKDIYRYNDSIALVATKVNNQYKIVNNMPKLISDEIEIINIAIYLKNLKISLEKLKTYNEEKKRKSLEIAIKIIDQLLVKDENENYKKINIFRKPSKPGAISSIPLLQEAKTNLQKALFESVNFTDVTEKKIGYSLSYKTKNYLNCLLHHINDCISKIASNVFQLIENNYEHKLKNVIDIYKTQQLLETFQKKVKHLKNDLKKSKDFKNFRWTLKDYFEREKINFNEGDDDLFYKVYDNINILQQFTSTASILSPLQWTEKINSLHNFIKNHLLECNFQIKLFQQLSNYTFQNSKHIYMNNEFDNLKNYTDIYRKLPIEDNEFYMSLLKTNNETTIAVDDIISFTILDKNNITCNNEGKLSIIGNFIKMSEINDTGTLFNYCNADVSIKTIVIAATHTVFFDADLNDDLFRGINIMITATYWEIIGKRIINISGRSGENHNVTKAEDGNEPGSNGKDGMAGLPGKNGGHFLGIGLRFINEENLVIETSGGKGGKGQDGGDGQNGENGISGYEKMVAYSNRYIPSNFSIDFGVEQEIFNEAINYAPKTSLKCDLCTANINIYRYNGERGLIGGKGGNGGVSGLGGNPGNVLVIGENPSVGVSIHNAQGISGDPGKGGNSGRLGTDGEHIECYKIKINREYYDKYDRDRDYGGYRSVSVGESKKYFWNCRNHTEMLSCISEKTTEPGLSNNSTKNLLVPDNGKPYDFSEDLYEYTLRLKENENNQFVNKMMNKFKEVIYKNISLMKSQFWRFILLAEKN